MRHEVWGQSQRDSRYGPDVWRRLRVSTRPWSRTAEAAVGCKRELPKSRIDPRDLAARNSDLLGSES